jgi:hypothetical protein
LRYDVAGFVISHPRQPREGEVAKDFSSPYDKPVDCPWGPSADSFSGAAQVEACSWGSQLMAMVSVWPYADLGQCALQAQEPLGAIVDQSVMAVSSLQMATLYQLGLRMLGWR